MGFLPSDRSAFVSIWILGLFRLLVSSWSQIEEAKDTNHKNPPHDNEEIAKNAAIVLSAEAEVKLRAGGNNFNPKCEEVSGPMLETLQILH